MKEYARKLTRPPNFPVPALYNALFPLDVTEENYQQHLATLPDLLDSMAGHAGIGAQTALADKLEFYDRTLLVIDRLAAGPNTPNRLIAAPLAALVIERTAALHLSIGQKVNERLGNSPASKVMEKALRHYDEIYLAMGQIDPPYQALVYQAAIDLYAVDLLAKPPPSLLNHYRIEQRLIQNLQTAAELDLAGFSHDVFAFGRQSLRRPVATGSLEKAYRHVAVIAGRDQPVNALSLHAKIATGYHRSHALGQIAYNHFLKLMEDLGKPDNNILAVAQAMNQAMTVIGHPDQGNHELYREAQQRFRPDYWANRSNYPYWLGRRSELN